jgi:non-ribosomal peptide synthetase component F
LGRVTAQTDLSIAVPVANRDHFQLENVIGLFTNTIPLLQLLDTKATFQDFVRSVGGNVHTAKEHGGVPFSKILFEAGLIADERMSAEQWVPAYFQLVESRAQLSIPLECYEIVKEFQYGVMNYELTAWVDASTDCIQVTLFGAHEVFDEKTLNVLNEVYEAILLRCPGVTSLSSLKDISDPEQET